MLLLENESRLLGQSRVKHISYNTCRSCPATSADDTFTICTRTTRVWCYCFSPHNKRHALAWCEHRVTILPHNKRLSAWMTCQCQHSAPAITLQDVILWVGVLSAVVQDFKVLSTDARCFTHDRKTAITVIKLKPTSATSTIQRTPSPSNVITANQNANLRFHGYVSILARAVPR